MTDETKTIAENTLQILLDFYLVELDEDADNPRLSKEERERAKALGSTRRQLLRAIEKGWLNIEEQAGDLQVTLKLVKPIKGLTELRFKELHGGAYMAMKRCDEEDHYGRIYALCTALTGARFEDFIDMKQPDLGNVVNLGTVFLKA